MLKNYFRRMPKFVALKCFSQIYSASDNTIDIGDVKKPSYKGSLIIVPTPLGNLSDMSLRQFETLTSTADIIACEDTRKTGKML